MGKFREIDTSVESPKAAAIRRSMERIIVGQEEAVNALIDLTEKFHANLFDKDRPIGTGLFLGPTGSGKTRIVEAYCNALFDNEKAAIKIDCGEFQHDHEISKLVGSPPGYLGHMATPAILTQENLSKSHTEPYPISVILFDEIEKASDTLWHLLLGVLDKGQITLGTNATTSFNKSIILMTSNAGSTEMNAAIGGGIGFQWESYVDEDSLAHIGVEAAKKKFTPEFINRLDRIIAFHTLSKENISKILDIELERLQNNILTKTNPIFFFALSPAAKKALIEEGFDPKYNGRNIRRTIEKHLQIPMARILSSRLVEPGNRLLIDYKRGDYKFIVVE